MKGNILVTGGAGYIGSHICKALHQADYQPVAFDNLVRGHRELVKWGPLFTGDITDPAALDQVMSAYSFEAVIHCAALAYVGESVRDPLLYYQNNVGGTLTLLEAMRSHQIDRIVFSSSCAVYGSQGTSPLDENTPPEPCSPYGWSKLMCEQALRDCTSWCNPTALRYFNAAGADPQGQTGEWHDPETHLIPLALDPSRTLQIFGTDYPTPDGTAIRDYLHVTDLAQAHLRALTYDGPHFALNLGSGGGHSVLQIIEEVERATGRPLPTQRSQRRPGDPAELIADNHLVISELGWSPQHSDLKTIVNTANNFLIEKKALSPV